MTHNHMAIVGLRILLLLLAMLYTVGGFLVFSVLGMAAEARTALVVGCIFGWLVSPGREEIEHYAQFQESRKQQ